MPDSLSALSNMDTALTVVNDLSERAKNTAFPPTFFNQSGSRIIARQDTQSGLVLLGLSPAAATTAALLLHTLFSYPTSDAWIPAFDTSLPVHIKNMSRTRLGANWGSFSRVHWVKDANLIDEVGENPYMRCRS